MKNTEYAPSASWYINEHTGTRLQSRYPITIAQAERATKIQIPSPCVCGHTPECHVPTTVCVSAHCTGVGCECVVFDGITW